MNKRPPQTVVGGGGGSGIPPTEQISVERSCKRDLVYSALSLIGFPLVVFYSSPNVSTTSELVAHIITQQEFPLQTIAAVIFYEIFKLVVVFSMYPSYHLYDLMASATSSKSSSAKLPVSRRDSSVTKSVPFHVKMIEFWKATWNFGLACGICHIFMVLFGAPFFNDFILTLQFSVILVCWTFSPLCLALRPSYILQELPYLSIWNTQIESISRAKWRFISTIVGAMIGAAFIPLDWDRPWQKWPITCLFTSAVAYLLVNSFTVAYLVFTKYFCKIQFPAFLNRSNGGKVKSF